jgi:hypothetical protein
LDKVVRAMAALTIKGNDAGLPKRQLELDHQTSFGKAAGSFDSLQRHAGGRD